jgi:hypothetical protein
MRPWRRLILRIPLAKATDPAHRVQTLLKRCEPAICTAAAMPTTIIRAPRIVLSFRACSNADNTDANSQHEQQESHSRLLGWPLSYKCPLFVFIPGPRGQRGEASGALHSFQPPNQNCADDNGIQNNRLHLASLIFRAVVDLVRQHTAQTAAWTRAIHKIHACRKEFDPVI